MNEHHTTLCMVFEHFNADMADPAARKDTTVGKIQPEILWSVHTLRPKAERKVKTVKPSTQEFCNNISIGNTIYDMDKDVKGKACVISIPQFHPGTGLVPLEGYSHDKVNLADMWALMGFLTLIPSRRAEGSLTAEEIRVAVREFAGKLDEGDQCCIVCILTHGGSDYLYGSDGGHVKISEVVSFLDNKHCSKMIGKPRVVLLQACAGTDKDVGVAAGSPPLAVPAADHNIHPSTSDVIVCSPCLPGKASFVYKEPGRGSVFIECLIEVFQEHACDSDILHLLTMVNDRVASRRTTVLEPSVKQYMQMSHFDSCLRRLLYFVPPNAEMNPRYGATLAPPGEESTTECNLQIPTEEREIGPQNVHMVAQPEPLMEDAEWFSMGAQGQINPQGDPREGRPECSEVQRDPDQERFHFKPEHFENSPKDETTEEQINLSTHHYC